MLKICKRSVACTDMMIIKKIKRKQQRWLRQVCLTRRTCRHLQQDAMSKKHHHQPPRNATSRPPSRDPRRKGHAGKSLAGALGTAGMVAFAAAVVAILVALVLKSGGLLEASISTPLSVPLVTNASDADALDRFWGSYRPGVYFGMKTRSPAGPLAGLMWYLPQYVGRTDLGLRHWTEEGDNLDRFGWTRHDGVGFGQQEIADRGLRLTTSFVKVGHGQGQGGEWTARIAAERDATWKKKPAESVSLLFYVGMDQDGGPLDGLKVDFHQADHRRIKSFQSRDVSSVGRFRVKFVEDGKAQHHFYTIGNSPHGPVNFDKLVKQRMRLHQQLNNAIGLDSQQQQQPDEEDPNLIVYQVTAELPFTLDVVYEAESRDGARQGELSGEAYSRALATNIEAFDERFEQTFKLREKGYNESAVAFARAAMSNMIGGIGYFYGPSLVQSPSMSHPEEYWRAPLYTAVPSRTRFPRGFLWDEGFHNLLISRWDARISADILGHWMDLVNSQGWIPREQILGLEAMARVPSEFIVQHSSNANPPTLLLTLHSMVQDQQVSKQDWFRQYLLRMWPRLDTWYNWFQTTQHGDIPSTYRWRGRNASAVRELNPKTLTSGLDDFPRASHPTDDERHVDLRCWMALASKLMADIGRIIGKDDKEVSKYSDTADVLHDNALLESTHWSAEHGAFLDWGLHTERARLHRPRPRQGQPQHVQPEMVREVQQEPKRQYVNQLGYVSLFPLLLQVLDPQSDKLSKVLTDIESPSAGLWTPFGLRSLSSKASLYGKRNTEHDPPYWRGPIWINANYLAVRALRHYAYQAKGPHSEQAERVYKKLRAAVVENVMREFWRTGYVWEQYDDKTGKGQSCKPFTGWSALVVLMMGEM